MKALKKPGETSRVSAKKPKPLKKKRARAQEEKDQRRDWIVAAGARLLERKDLSAIKMDEIAQAAGVAKGTLYLYFKTKEELFLAIHLLDYEAWFQELDSLLGVGAGAGARNGALELDSFAEWICDSLERHKRLAASLAIVNSVLEHNVTLEYAIQFKRRLLEITSAAVPAIERRIPAIRKGEGFAFLMHFYALVVGTWVQAHPSPILRKAIAEPGLEAFQVSFRELLGSALRVYFRGLVGEGR